MIESLRQIDCGRRARWEIFPRASSDRLSRLGDLAPLLAQLLLNRGVYDVAAARRFLYRANEPLGDPRSMADLPRAVARVSQALSADEIVAVYGDYDVDGLTAAAVLVSTLRLLGGSVLVHIPHRLQDGYGLQDRALDELRAAGAGLVITVDCGVTARPEIERCRSRGLDVIVTDHHLAPAELPDAPVLNPTRPDCGYLFKELAGVGVAFRMAQALLDEHLPEPLAEARTNELLDLVAIGTLADVVPLRGENRTLVKRGLNQLRQTQRAGLRALMAVAGLAPTSVDAEHVRFALIPRLNAPGRVDHARIALDLLLADDDDVAQVLAERINLLNGERQTLTATALAAAREQLSGSVAQPAILIAGDLPLGVVGLVATRLSEESGRPAIVLALNGDTYTGSARSVPGLNLVEILRETAGHLSRFGGHAMAAGLSLKRENLRPFEEALQAAVGRLPGLASAARSLVIDAELRPETATSWQTLGLLEQLEPFGPSNPAPVFLTRNLRLVERRCVGERAHRLRLATPKATVRAIDFRPSDPYPAEGDCIDLVYRLRRRQWRGSVTVEAEVLDWRPAS